MSLELMKSEYMKRKQKLPVSMTAHSSNHGHLCLILPGNPAPVQRLAPGRYSGIFVKWRDKYVFKRITDLQSSSLY